MAEQRGVDDGQFDKALGHNGGMVVEAIEPVLVTLHACNRFAFHIHDRDTSTDEPAALLL